MAESQPPGLASPATTTRPDRVRCRVYGGKAALCIETDETRQGEPTLRIEAARATAPREYDWRQKLALQLTREELPVIAATVLGLLPRCAYNNHGPNQDKGLEIVHQGTHLFVRRVSEGSRRGGRPGDRRRQLRAGRLVPAPTAQDLALAQRSGGDDLAEADRATDGAAHRVTPLDRSMAGPTSPERLADRPIRSLHGTHGAADVLSVVTERT